MVRILYQIRMFLMVILHLQAVQFAVKRTYSSVYQLVGLSEVKICLLQYLYTVLIVLTNITL
jgi:hypothetical protein